LRVRGSISDAAEGAGVVPKSVTGTRARFLKFTSERGLDELEVESLAIVDSILDTVVGVVDARIRMALAQRSSNSGEDLRHRQGEVRQGPHIVMDSPTMCVEADGRGHVGLKRALESTDEQFVL
jgi:hypothetical protein